MKITKKTTEPKPVVTVVLELTIEEAEVLNELIGNHSDNDVIAHGLSNDDNKVLDEIFNGVWSILHI